ncbi:hypothetical protein PbDSM24746_30440 [Paenibacillus macerans]|nr:hypothetical protein PbDSM24746_30440 [Paenibacillus macerans]
MAKALIMTVGMLFIIEERTAATNQEPTVARNQSLIAYPLKYMPKSICQAHISEPIHNDVHADGKDDDSPWRSFDDLPGMNFPALSRQNLKDDRGCTGDDGYRNPDPFARQVGDQESRQDHP